MKMEGVDVGTVVTRATDVLGEWGDFPVELMAQCWSKLLSGGHRVTTKPNTEKE